LHLRVGGIEGDDLAVAEDQVGGERGEGEEAEDECTAHQYFMITAKKWPVVSG
jgi:hypothetical protein